ncbi:hypothetical protein ISF_01721 [Cordyceps fumosorosea ARSEF 2679]|uniref:Major facilitator superfamily transporter n=1 Tax=Cordyceps fumosorosea (strain ARSEF 2679) TaxID=1081104 RepID=A0A168CAY2_CORFA|nr:hypothetical protein ISF_01721 [Cordyceps fumosorosea ARSEF 2679]OAA71170.1 hypothetical protein ISF_01721 [Cordyceps fumosorosea ARSEF 2679]
MPRPYSPYNGSEPTRTCYLDRENTVAAPDIYAYDGVPRHMPAPLLGSYELLRIRDDVCFDRFGRYGPYGLGYGPALGGVGFENETEHAHSEHVWTGTGQIDYRRVDWADAQQRCRDANNEAMRGSESRTAVVVRAYEGYTWTPMAVLNLRAMVTELALKTGGAYSVHVLLQVKDARFPVEAAADPTVRYAYLARHGVPAEFRGLVTLWSEPQMRRAYPGDFPPSFRNPTGKGVHDVYRSPHLALQEFAEAHPEYAHFWNWELDARVLGSYFEMLDGIGRWADARPRELLWEHAERYYIPRHHGSWEDFTRAVRKQQRESGRLELPPEPLRADWRTRLEDGGDVLPADCAWQPATCGVGEPADLVTLSPIFDVLGSSWFFADDATGYPASLRATLPRRAAIVTAGRYSRRLLAAMREEVRGHGRTMFAEMFPASAALHHGLKAVYAPHPVHAGRRWERAAAVDQHFNSGARGSTSGRGGPFSLSTERVHDVASWYYRSSFAQSLWRRWLGYGEDGGEEEGGRMCLRSMLLHPIKHEHPSE